MEFKIGLRGEYKIETVKIIEGVEKRKLICDWFPNIITNGGLNRVGVSSTYLDYCHVGSGSASPSLTDTALETFIGASSDVQSSSNVSSGSPDYTMLYTKVFRFDPGVATGNLSEVGIGWTLATGSLFSRALILDGVGSPTTITVLADEYLDVTYRLSLQPPISDFIGSVVFTGSIGGTYDFIIRARAITSVSTGISGWGLPAAANGVAGQGGTPNKTNLYSGAIGAITNINAGTATSVNCVASAYVTDSFEISYTISADIGQANYAGGILSAGGRYGLCLYQIGFDPAIPKTSSDILSFVLNISWGRA